MDKIIRKATIDDIDFIIQTITKAEKSGTPRLGLASCLSMPEQEWREILGKMLLEEIDGCEYSISSFLIAENDRHEPIGAAGAWIEGLNEDEQPSGILRANLMNYTLPKQYLFKLHEISPIISDLYIPRTLMTLQFEYLYVDAEYRGNGISQALYVAHISNALEQMPSLQLAQRQLYKSNMAAYKCFNKLGFKVSCSTKSTAQVVMDNFPCNEKIGMELVIKK
ncbi:MAG: GNAT family N-acetyltransferase [Muribaculaceae bacterium]